MTQAQLAEAIGMSDANLSRIEASRQDFTGTDLAAIGKALGIEVADLFRNPNIAPDPNEEKLSKAWNRAAPTTQAQIADIAERLAPAQDGADGALPLGQLKPGRFGGAPALSPHP